MAHRHRVFWSLSSELVLRWVRFHLRRAHHHVPVAASADGDGGGAAARGRSPARAREACRRRLRNFGGDLSDSVSLVALLRRIAPHACAHVENRRRARARNASRS